MALVTLSSRRRRSLSCALLFNVGSSDGRVSAFCPPNSPAVSVMLGKLVKLEECVPRSPTLDIISYGGCSRAGSNNQGHFGGRDMSGDTIYTVRLVNESSLTSCGLLEVCCF